MPIKGKHYPKMSEAKMGNKAHLGKPHTKEAKEKNRQAHLGKHPSKDTIRKMRESAKKSINAGRFKKGMKHTDEWKEKARERMKNNTNGFQKGDKYWLGKKRDNIREKLRLANLGAKSNLWQGGISFEPYSTDWTDTLKRSIRQRDNYTCRWCGKEPAICVHHIDYDKKNCDPKNLITLCRKCHSKTNFNKNYWKKLFLNFIN
jgi:hypothetical protein